MNHRKICSLSLIAYLIFCLLPYAHSAHAQESEKGSALHLFYRGNTFYEEGRYDKAIEEYEKLLEQGFESGNLYFNLANSYYKLDKHGKSVLNYERAKRLIPRDGDLKANEKFALSGITASSSGQSRRFPARVSGKMANFTINEMTIFISLVYTCLMAVLLFLIFMPRFRKYVYSSIIIALIVIALASYSLYSRISVLDKEAVIITAAAEARFEPFDNATIHFTLHEGTKITVIQAKKEWTKIKRPDGKIGWIRSETSEII